MSDPTTHSFNSKAKGEKKQKRSYSIGIVRIHTSLHTENRIIMKDLPQILDGEDKQSAFKNCIRNHYKHLRKWAKRTQTDCFRLYDRQIHHFPLAIDYYDHRYCIHYFLQKEDGEEPPKEIVAAVEEALRTLLGAEPSQIFWRTRFKRQRTQQYEKKDQKGDFFPVLEHGVKFYVNLMDYLDTGLFLDHRETRQLAASLSRNKKVLNLFAYTCSFSVHAAIHGALSTKSVDMSNTYLAWGKENFLLNDLSLDHHQFVRADCLKFLEQEVARNEQYDLVIIDPPTLSRSKKMERFFDIQQDHPWLIKQALQLLRPEGTILFSTNSRRFTFDEAFLKENVEIKEISSKTLPIDFQDPHIHRCWLMTKRQIA